MRILTFFIFFSSLILPPSQNIKTVSQSFSVHNLTTSLITQLDGDVEFIQWNKDELLVETSIIDESENPSNYILNYFINKKNLELNCSLIGDARTLLLTSKKLTIQFFQREENFKLKKYSRFIFHIDCSLPYSKL